MKNKISITIFLLLISISFISAISIYAGEPVEIELEKPFEYYSIIGNSTPITLDVTQNGNFVIIIPDKYSQNDSYEVVFFDINKEVIVNHYSSGGGGSSTKWKTKYVNDTEYVKLTDTQYKDKEVEVEVTKEVEVKKTSWVAWGCVGILALIILYLIFFKNAITREVKNNGQEKNNDVSNSSSGDYFS